MSDWLGLTGQRVLIAGGGGTIGRALVDGFATAGATVAVVDVTDDAMAGLDDQTVLRHPADLSDASRSAARALLDDVFEDMTDHDWEHALGGVHALMWEEAELVGHASLIQRRIVSSDRW